jgi:hypothetical protein
LVAPVGGTAADAGAGADGGWLVCAPAPTVKVAASAATTNKERVIIIWNSFNFHSVSTRRWSKIWNFHKLWRLAAGSWPPGILPGLRRRQAKPNLIMQSIAKSFCAAIRSGKTAQLLLRAKPIHREPAEGETHDIRLRSLSGRIIGAPKISRQSALLIVFIPFSPSHVIIATNSTQRLPKLERCTHAYAQCLTRLPQEILRSIICPRFLVSKVSRLASRKETAVKQNVRTLDLV